LLTRCGQRRQPHASRICTDVPPPFGQADGSVPYGPASAQPVFSRQSLRCWRPPEDAPGDSHCRLLESQAASVAMASYVTSSRRGDGRPGVGCAAPPLVAPWGTAFVWFGRSWSRNSHTTFCTPSCGAPTVRACGGGWWLSSPPASVNRRSHQKKPDARQARSPEARDPEIAKHEVTRPFLARWGSSMRESARPSQQALKHDQARDRPDATARRAHSAPKLVGPEAPTREVGVFVANNAVLCRRSLPEPSCQYSTLMHRADATGDQGKRRGCRACLGRGDRRFREGQNAAMIAKESPPEQSRRDRRELFARARRSWGVSRRSVSSGAPSPGPSTR